jgi:hypothetical protein
MKKTDISTKKSHLFLHGIIVCVFLTVVLLQFSCSEDFLKPEPLSFYAPENVYVDKEGFEAGLISCKRMVKNELYGGWNNQQLEYATSDYGYGLNLTDYTKMTPSSKATVHDVLGMFSKTYGYIKDANVIISRIDNIEWDKEEDRNFILASAMFYRAWWYYRLITSYGDVPYIGYELTEARLDFYTHSRWAILDKIIKDMEFVKEWLPEKSEPGELNRYVALHFLAKLYLANSEYDKSINAATEVINGPYELMTQRFGADADNPAYNLIWDLHRPVNKSIPTNKETIWNLIDRVDGPDDTKAWRITMRGFHSQWWWAWVLDSQGKRATLPEGPQYKALGRANSDVYQSRWVSYELWEEFGHSWKTTPDLRRSDACWWESHEILSNNPASVDYGKPINFQYLANKYDSLRLWPMAYYKTYYPHADDYQGVPYGGNGDSYMFRLGGTYLLRAEAYFWKGDKENAAKDINKVRERANAIPVSAADIDIDYIFDERMRELYLEEFRHSEMVRVANIMARNKIGGYSLDNLHEKNWWYDRVKSRNTWFKEGKIGPNEYIVTPRYIFWPIEIQVITTNTMGVINQNRGYPGDELNIPPLTEIIDEGRPSKD